MRNALLGITLVSEHKAQPGHPYGPCRNQVIDPVKGKDERSCGANLIICGNCRNISYCRHCETCAMCENPLDGSKQAGTQRRQ